MATVNTYKKKAGAIKRNSGHHLGLVTVIIETPRQRIGKYIYDEKKIVSA